VSDPTDAVEILTVLTENLMAVTLTPERIDYFLYTVFLDNPEDHTYALGSWRQEWNAYQDSSNEKTVRMLLNRLLSKLIQTPEFQLY
jgi:hypothetical protein